MTTLSPIEINECAGKKTYKSRNDGIIESRCHGILLCFIVEELMSLKNNKLEICFKEINFKFNLKQDISDINILYSIYKLVVLIENKNIKNLFSHYGHLKG